MKSRKLGHKLGKQKIGRPNVKAIALLIGSLFFWAIANSSLVGRDQTLALASTCVAGVDCPPPPVQFVPGQAIRIEIVNLTQTLVYLEKVQGEPPIDVIPGQLLTLATLGNSINNLSLLFWDNQGSILTLRPVKVNNTTLRIEVRAGAVFPGDRSVYLRDDGRVLVL